MTCNHDADSGYNYPEGKCSGMCMAGDPLNHVAQHFRVDSPQQPPKPSHTLRRVATVLGFMAIGMCLTVLHHDYTITLQRENDALRALNMQLLKDADAAMHCEPRDEQSKAIMQRINGDLRCEIHTIRKGI